MTSRWVTIHVCEYGEALVLRGELEANGIPVDVPGESMIRSDLFMRGGNGFALEVRVPDTAEADARALLAPFEHDGGAQLGGTAEQKHAREREFELEGEPWVAPDVAFTGDAKQELGFESARGSVDPWSRPMPDRERVAWGAASGWLAPWALAHGLRTGAGADASPAQRRDFRVALVVAAIATLLVLGYVATRLFDVFD
jgi:hypothetical protein